MKDYLPQRTADYTSEQLDVTPQKVLNETPVEDTQLKRRTDAGELNVVEIDAPIKFEVQVQWDILTSSDADYIRDLYTNSSKANRHKNSIEWVHPVDGNVYIVRFLSNVAQEIKPANNRAIPQITLLVEGYK